MTREEQIKEYLQERNIPIDSLEANSIREGVGWADENPKEGLVSIDRVCDYLGMRIDEYIIRDLRKAMEG